MRLKRQRKRAESRGRNGRSNCRRGSNDFTSCVSRLLMLFDLDIHDASENGGKVEGLMSPLVWHGDN